MSRCIHVSTKKMAGLYYLDRLVWNGYWEHVLGFLPWTRRS